ncbi:MAG: Indole-3-glycerol phosphate synthase [Candidatus Erwinia impunctatus]|nr:Indole-3-glycerol phosphate synthase [Culicoides impunctatus]
MSAFIQALRTAAVPLIAEIKPFSPEYGDLLRGRNPSDIARSYVSQGVSCLSVTTGRWHHGTLRMLQEIAHDVAVPVLRKDFITRRTQLAESRDAGAAAVLLSAQLLRRQELSGLVTQALEMGLTPFIEADNARQLTGLQLPAESVLAICNRDIRQQEKDDGSVNRSLSLYQLARDCGAGLLVSASAMRQPEDVLQAWQAGFDAMLIGTALLVHEPVEQTLASFIQILTLDKKAFISSR